MREAFQSEARAAQSLAAGEAGVRAAARGGRSGRSLGSASPPMSEPANERPPKMSAGVATGTGVVASPSAIRVPPGRSIASWCSHHAADGPPRAKAALPPSSPPTPWLSIFRRRSVRRRSTCWCSWVIPPCGRTPSAAAVPAERGKALLAFTGARSTIEQNLLDLRFQNIERFEGAVIRRLSGALRPLRAGGQSEVPPFDPFGVVPTLVTSAAFSPRGHRLAVAESRTVCQVTVQLDPSTWMPARVP